MLPIILTPGGRSPLLSINCLAGCTWSSSNTKIATISDDGVTGREYGTVTVTATSAAGVVVDQVQVVVGPSLHVAKQLSGAFIAGITIGTIAFVAVIAVVIYVIVRKHKPLAQK